MGALAAIMNGQGKLVQAEELFRELLEIELRVLGTEHAETLQTQMNLAVTINNQDRFDEAESHQRLYRRHRTGTRGQRLSRLAFAWFVLFGPTYSDPVSIAN